jgi:uncharacterized membrane protein (UPF0127 family)
MATRLILPWLAMLAAAMLLAGCDRPTGAADATVVSVTVTDNAGTEHSFRARARARRRHPCAQGLSYRTEIAADGGMAFFFTTARQQSFVMRHCPIPIDIVYVDGSGRVVSHHAMQPEEPQGENESEAAYNRRLKRYPSRFAVPIVLEFQGGTIERLGIDEGDMIEIDDLKGWRARAR